MEHGMIFYMEFELIIILLNIASKNKSNFY